MYSPDPAQQRRVFLTAWHKARNGEPLSALEQRLVAIMHWHPQLQPILSAPDVLTRAWDTAAGELNPFLHWGLHLTVQEQVALDDPPGIRALHQRLLQASRGDAHTAEHHIMHCLGIALHALQQQGAFQPRPYLACIERQLGLVGTTSGPHPLPPGATP